jgi:hypothetical protein
MPAYMDGELIVIAGRHVAAVRKGALLRTFDARRELLRGGLSFRCDVLNLAVDAGATKIICRERGSGTLYSISVGDFYRRGWAYHHADYGDQWACDLRHWSKVTPEPEPEPGGAVQLGLFGGLATNGR